MPQHYAAASICEDCLCTRSGPLRFSDARPDAPWAATVRTCAEVIHAINDREIEFPLTMIPGWHNQSQFEDFLHDDLLGVRLYGAGATLVELCRQGEFDSFDHLTMWRDKVDAQLMVAFGRFCEWAGARGESHSQARFTSLSLTMKVKHDGGVLKAKGKNCQVVSAWLRDICVHRQDDTYGRIRSMMWDGFAESYEILRATKFPNWRLTSAQADSLEAARSKTLQAMNWLQHQNAIKGINAYRCTPKFHKLDKLLRRAVRTRTSPTLFWTFVQESQMGQTSRVVHKLHGASSSRRGVERWLLYFFHVLEGFAPPG